MPDIASILLVEDDPDDAELILYAFNRARIVNPIVRLSDGDAAVEYMCGLGRYQDRQAHPLPRLVLLDLRLPRRSGFEVLGAVRKDPVAKHTPITVLTSSDVPDDIERAYAAGANSFLVKPVRQDALLSLVEALGAYWIKFNRVAPVRSASNH